MTKPTILLADNDDIFLKTTKEYLEENGYTVLCAKTPQSARRILRKNIVALALIDYRLTDDDDDKDESGYTLARDAIKLSSIPRVILTKFDDRTDAVVKSLRRDKNGRSPAVNYILKKDGLESMLAVIKDTLSTVKIFLCYAHYDRAKVNDLYENLVSAGYSPWMDKRNLMPGEKWSHAIEKAINSADFFIVCISRNSVNRRGFLQREIRMAMEIWAGKLDDDIYLIPARLEDCEIPDEKLTQLQWLDLFQPEGIRNLVDTIQAGVSRQQFT
jgi:CheY-like chemotaxis protein